jgi:hypothetical protein
MEPSAEELAQTFEQAKEDVESMLFKGWVRSERTAEGWILVSKAPHLDVDGNEKGIVYRIEIRTQVGGQAYRCAGGVPKAEDIDAVVKACTTLKRK